MNVGIVEYLFLKQKHKTPMSSLSKIYLCQEYGIEGDINSDRTSPRQILLVDANDTNKLSIAPGELRENIVLKEIDSAIFKPGAKLTFSSGAEIRLTFYCEPCKRISHLVDSLQSIERKRGILGVVVTEGKIIKGDHVVIKPNYFPPLSEIPYQRFLQLVNKIPPGKVITYKQVLKSIGVDRSYYRVMPLYLKKAPTGYPIHRVLNSQGQTISHISQHRAKLAAEGVEVSVKQTSVEKSNNHYISLKDYGWQSPSIC